MNITLAPLHFVLLDEGFLWIVSPSLASWIRMSCALRPTLQRLGKAWTLKGLMETCNFFFMLGWCKKKKNQNNQPWNLKQFQRQLETTWNYFKDNLKQFKDKTVQRQFETVRTQLKLSKENSGSSRILCAFTKFIHSLIPHRTRERNKRSNFQIGLGILISFLCDLLWK